MVVEADEQEGSFVVRSHLANCHRRRSRRDRRELAMQIVPRSRVRDFEKRVPQLGVQRVDLAGSWVAMATVARTAVTEESE